MSRRASPGRKLGGNRSRDERDAVEQGTDNSGPPIGRDAPDDRAPFQRDSHLGRGPRAERSVGVDDRRPLAYGGGRRGEEECNGRRPRTRRPIERNRAAASNTARREKVTDRSGDGEEPITGQDRRSGPVGRRPQLRPGLLVPPGQARGDREIGVATTIRR